MFAYLCARLTGVVRHGATPTLLRYCAILAMGKLVRSQKAQQNSMEARTRNINAA